MKNFKRKMMKAMAITLTIMTCGTVVGCGPQGVELEPDPTMSYLYVSTRDAGTGTIWLEEMKKGFEEKYAETSFADGKKGVTVNTEAIRAASGQGLLGTLANSEHNICMVESLHYVDYMAGNLLYDITDWVEEDLSDGSGSIASKISKEHKEYLTGFDGNYYALPWFSGFNGVTYDAEMFDEKGLWFADESGYKPSAKSTYTDAAYTGRGFVSAQNSKKSCGPDGVYNTLDDGLPSSYEEFFYLCEYMTEIKQVTPFIYTGASEHYLNYMFQALTLNWSGKEDATTMYTFDSGNDTVSIITGFDGDTPIQEEIKINKDNGYLTTQLAGKYYATKFMEEIFKNEGDYFYSRSFNTTFTNLEAQTIFINSNLDPDYSPIGMIIEGGYWYQEAESALEASENKYGSEAQNRNFRFMTMPSQETGTVNEGVGKSIVLGDGLGCHLLVNNNIKNNPEKLAIAKAFLQYCFEQASLQTVTAKTGVPIAVNYDMDTNAYGEMCNYAQSLWDAYSTSLKNNSYCTTCSGSKIFLANYPVFEMGTGGWCSYDSGADSYETVRNGVKANLSAKEYFQGTGISKSSWDSNYNIYD